MAAATKRTTELASLYAPAAAAAAAPAPKEEAAATTIAVPLLGAQAAAQPAPSFIGSLRSCAMLMFPINEDQWKGVGKVLLLAAIGFGGYLAAHAIRTAEEPCADMPGTALATLNFPFGNGTVPITSCFPVGMIPSHACLPPA